MSFVFSIVVANTNLELDETSYQVMTVFLAISVVVETTNQIIAIFLVFLYWFGLGWDVFKTDEFRPRLPFHMGYY